MAKKQKVIHLTDEQYNKYIMALKDEEPPKVIVKDEKEKDKD